MKPVSIRLLLPPLACLVLFLVAGPNAWGRASSNPDGGFGVRSLPATYADISNGNLLYTISDVGAHGWFDPVGSQNVGSGFQFLGFPNALFHAGLIVATDDLHVEDACYGSDDNGASIPFNFTHSCEVQLGASPDIEQQIFSRFNDLDADGPPLGIEVRQYAYAWSFPPDDKYVILEFDLINQSAAQEVYVGWYADWDITDGTQNEVDYDGARWVGTMTDATGVDPNYYGIAALSHPPSGYRAVHNPTWVYPDGEYTGDPGFEDADKFEFLTGFDTTSSDVPDDWSHMIGIGPLLVPEGGSVRVAFLVVAGTSLADLETSVDAARARYPLCRPAVHCP